MVNSKLYSVYHLPLTRKPQIREQVKAAILNDEINEGDILPSIRQLAGDLKISVITTTRAYTELEQEGYIINVQGKGCYVAPKDSDLLLIANLIYTRKEI